MLQLLQTSLMRVNIYLKFIGLCPDIKDNKRTILKRLYYHPIYLTHFISFNLEVAAEIWWLVDGIVTGKSFLEITYLLPCLLLCLQSIYNSFSFLYCTHHTNYLIGTMEKLQSNEAPMSKEREFIEKKVTQEQVSVLMNISKRIFYLICMGMLLFLLGPVFLILWHYYKTGEMELVLPFIGKYPFNEFDLRIYPFIYLHQMWTGIEAVMFVYAPDCFFYTCCTFINIQFILLQYDMERIVSEKSHKYDKSYFERLVVRHITIMRCIDLLEKIFSKSILFNALTSSVIICVTGFNVVVVENVVIMASFTVFLCFGLLRIFMYCFYGDIIMRSSVQVSDAIYNSHWYNVDLAERKNIIIVLIRAQTPCKLTAYKFFDINLGAFTSILSTSWSYFALLNTMYQPE